MKFDCANHKQIIRGSPKSRQNKHWHAWVNPQLDVLFTAATILLSPYNCDFDNNMILTNDAEPVEQAEQVWTVLVIASGDGTYTKLLVFPQQAQGGIAQTSRDLPLCINIYNKNRGRETSNSIKNEVEVFLHVKNDALSSTYLFL